MCEKITRNVMIQQATNASSLLVGTREILNYVGGTGSAGICWSL